MKKIIIICFIVPLLSLCYNKLKADCGKPLSHLDDAIAKERIAFFEKIKRKFIGAELDVSSIKVAKNDLVTLLEKFAAANKYDGVRIYYILDESNKLSIALVPTSITDIDDPEEVKISDDDISNYYVLLKNGKFVKKSYEYVKRNNLKYQRKISKKIEVGLFETYNLKLEETHSIWYSKELMFSEPDGGDLLSYLKCDTQNGNKIKNIVINFGSWTYDITTEPNDLKFTYKADIIFEFSGDEEFLYKYFTLGNIEVKRNYIADGKSQDFISKLSSGYTDTGLPCPPNKCP